MIHRPRRGHSLAPTLLALALLALGAPAAAREPRPVAVKLEPAGVESVRLVPTGEGRYAYDVLWQDGRRESLTPDEFAALLYTAYSGRSRFFALLNITAPVGVAWVGLGLLGQVLFTGRMLVQWIASERRRRSIVPTAFWWMSVGGATLLIVYFVWRKDIVGVLGQATGWVIYLRNLRLIYRTPREELPASLR